MQQKTREIEARILWPHGPGEWRPVASESQAPTRASTALEVAWARAFRDAERDLQGESDDRDCDGFWTAVLMVEDGEDCWVRLDEIDLPHDGTRVPSVADVVAALDLHLTKPHAITVELGFAARHGGRGPLQLELEVRPAAK